MRSAITIYLIVFTALIACKSDERNQDSLSPYNSISIKSQVQKKKQEEFNPALIYGSDILSIVLSYLKFQQFDELVKYTYSNDSEKEIKTFYKSLKSYPRIEKNKAFSVVKWTKDTDSTYTVYYEFKEFYRTASSKHVQVFYDNKDKQPKIILGEGQGINRLIRSNSN